MKVYLALFALIAFSCISFAMTPEECASQAVECSATCCAQAQCSVIGSGDDRYCRCVDAPYSTEEAEANWEECHDSICVPQLNACLSANVPGGTPGDNNRNAGCCGAGLVLLVTGFAGVMLARKVA